MRCPGDSRWSFGKVIEVLGFQSYLVEVNGTRYRRNQRYLRTTAEQLPLQTKLSDTDESLTEETINDSAELDDTGGREMRKTVMYAIQGETVVLQNASKITSVIDTEHFGKIVKCYISSYSVLPWNNFLELVYANVKIIEQSDSLVEFCFDIVLRNLRRRDVTMLE